MQEKQQQQRTLLTQVNSMPTGKKKLPPSSTAQMPDVVKNK
jgi:hypothetical protein